MIRQLLFITCLLLATCITANADDIPNDEIWYEASEKLTETTVLGASGLHTDVFNTSFSSHTFNDGKGIIKFNGDVTSIGGYAFNNCSGLTSITIPNSVTSIGCGAFEGCLGLPIENNIRYADTYLIGAVDRTLSSYTIKEDTKFIGDYAFSDCYSLTSVTIPNSVMSIGACAFSNCSGLTSITIPNSVSSIGGWAISGCSGLKAVTIGNSVTNIGEHTFNGCSSLTSITIPNSVTSIGEYAFNGCSGLTSIAIPHSVKSIGACAFYNCLGLTSIEVDPLNSNYDSRDNCNAIIETSSNTLIAGFKNTIIPKSVTIIGDWAFYGCYGLASITIPNSVISIGQYAFFCCENLKSVTIGNSVKSIGERAFKGCSGLTSVTISNSVTSLGKEAFNGCSRLTSITIPHSVTSIGSSAFSYCSGLKSVTIGNSVTSIGTRAFYKCVGLKSVIIGNSVVSIGESAFDGCSGLQSVKVGWDRPLSIQTNIFSGVDKSTCILYVPKGTATMYMAAPVWIEFVNIQEYNDGEDECVVTLKQGDGGCIKDVVEVGKTAQYIISPADGWSINSVSFNGADVTNQLTDGRYTTPVITGNSELNVVFKQGGSGVKDLTNSSVKVLASDGCVTITGNDSNECVSVYSVGGSEVVSDSGNCTLRLDSGVYIIKVGKEVFKVSI